jgi:serine/threonine protein kinase
VLLTRSSFDEDAKDSNDGPVAKLCDFGLSKLQLELQTSSSGGGAKGTRRWHAPELVQRKTKNTPATDVWALGLLCVELITGGLPYGDEETEIDVESNLNDKDAANLDLHLDDREDDGVECSAPLRAAIDACLQRDPAMRASAAEVVLLLQQAETRYTAYGP